MIGMIVIACILIACLASPGGSEPEAPAFSTEKRLLITNLTEPPINPGGLERWLETCPQVGSAGIHSTEYLDGELPCKWCGAEPQARCIFCDGNSACNMCDEDGYQLKLDARIATCARAEYPYTRGDGHNVADGCGPDGCPPCTCEVC